MGFVFYAINTTGIDLRGGHMSFVFYDTETTGIDTSFDQVMQFAAIKTDEDLNIIERFEIRSRLLPFVVPAPGALRVTKMTIDRLHDPATLGWRSGIGHCVLRPLVERVLVRSVLGSSSRDAQASFCRRRPSTH